MRIGFLFHKDPLSLAKSIDLIRLRALSEGLLRLGAAVSDVSIVAPVSRSDQFLGRVPVLPLAVLAERNRFDILKTCYHFSLELLGAYEGPLISRLVRVVDERAPERDAAGRGRLLACQELARERAWGVVLNNHENVRRWRERYGATQRAVIISTGCPTELPLLGPTPYPEGESPLLFLGSLASPRMLEMLNEAAVRLQDVATVHFVGRNKTALYGGRELSLSPLVVEHGETDEETAFTFARHARLGLALAAGPDIFDNDLSKILTYLRAGLPVLGEERLANAKLFTRVGFGTLFRYGDAADLARKARALLTTRFDECKAMLMGQMATRHSWDRRAAVLLRFCQSVAAR